MDLEEFISTTLTSIRSGIRRANESATTNSYVMTSSKDQVNFDIAVEVTSEKQSSKGGALRIKVIEGNLGGTRSEKESNVSRIKFTVGINTHIK